MNGRGRNPEPLEICSVNNLFTRDLVFKAPESWLSALHLWPSRKLQGADSRQGAKAQLKSCFIQAALPDPAKGMLSLSWKLLQFNFLLEHYSVLPDRYEVHCFHQTLSSSRQGLHVTTWFLCIQAAVWHRVRCTTNMLN